MDGADQDEDSAGSRSEDWGWDELEHLKEGAQEMEVIIPPNLFL